MARIPREGGVRGGIPEVPVLSRSGHLTSAFFYNYCTIKSTLDEFLLERLSRGVRASPKWLYISIQKWRSW